MVDVRARRQFVAFTVPHEGRDFLFLQLWEDQARQSIKNACEIKGKAVTGRVRRDIKSGRSVLERAI